ncbi:uncharacterized protein LOC143446047 isoform X2 [Clavelina lepadiformis]|uniref:uncharacterized protein LOC143446047 isoform X2 n=1 Tax=Clavelina lepadiformis TaxID=159417 RepID=UPI0040438F33
MPDVYIYDGTNNVKVPASEVARMSRQNNFDFKEYNLLENNLHFSQQSDRSNGIPLQSNKDGLSRALDNDENKPLSGSEQKAVRQAAAKDSTNVSAALPSSEKKSSWFDGCAIL